MNAPGVSTLPIGMARLAATVSAQTNTGETRARAAQATTEWQREARARPPVAEPVAAGDFRPNAHRREHPLKWQATLRAVRAHAAAARSQLLTVKSKDGARTVPHRVHGAQPLAERAAVLRSVASAQ